MLKNVSHLNGRGDKLEELVERFRIVDREIKQLTITANQLKNEIIDRLNGAEAVYNRQGHIIATYKMYERKSFDQKSFEQAFPEYYRIYVVSTVYRTFQLK